MIGIRWSALFRYQGCYDVRMSDAADWAKGDIDPGESLEKFHRRFGNVGFRDGRVQELSAASEFFLAVAVAEETIIAQAHESPGQDVQQEAANELLRIQGHLFLFPVVGIVLVKETDLVIFDAEQTVVAHGNPVGVGAEIADDLLGAGEGALGVDRPGLGLEGGDEAGEFAGVGKVGGAGVKLQLALVEGALQRLQVLGLEDLGKGLDRKQEDLFGVGVVFAVNPPLPIFARSPAGNDAMNMYMGS